MLGRFGGRDPIEYFGGATLYTYAGNNPLRWTDSHGLFHGGIGFLGGLPGYSPGSTWNPEGDVDKSGGNQEDMTATAITGALIVSAGAGGIAGVGSEAVDTVIEVGLGVSLPMSPADALQDLGKSLLKRNARKCCPRPGSISGNPANRLIDVPTKNGTLVRRHVCISAEDAQRYRDAVRDRYNDILNETPPGLSDEAIHAWRFEQLNAFRREWLDGYYSKRP